MIDETIKQLRIKNNMPQSQLAKRLGVTRSSVNAWEMGISVPTTQYLVELSLIFQVSTDYLQIIFWDWTKRPPWIFPD